MGRKARSHDAGPLLAAKAEANLNGWKKKSFRTRDGREVRILGFVKELGTRCYVGVVINSTGVAVLEQWQVSGQHPVQELSLVEIR